MSTQQYICEICNNQIFARRSHYLSHLQTKKHICRQLHDKSPVIKGQSNSFTILEKKIHKIIELYNLKTFNDKEESFKYEECIEAVKSLKYENKKLSDEVKKLKSAISNLKNSKILTNIENVTQNTNTINDHSVNIHLGVGISPFGRENWDYLSTDVVIPIMKRVNECIPELIKLLHFHEGHPENHNLFIPNKRMNQVKVFDGKKWETKEKNVTIDELKNKIIEKLETDYEAMFNQKSSQFIQNLWNQLRDGETNKTDQKELRNSIEYAILDNHTVVKDSLDSIKNIKL